MILQILISALLFSSFSATELVTRKARNFHLKTVFGQTVSLKDFRGEVVLLNFWATWGSLCKKELPYLAELQARYTQKGLKVLTINIDNRQEKAIRFLQKHHIQLLTLWDRKKRVARTYYVENVPSSYLIDRAGRIRFVHRGYREAQMDKITKEIEKLLREKPGQFKPTKGYLDKVSSLAEKLCLWYKELIV